MKWAWGKSYKEDYPEIYEKKDIFTSNWARKEKIRKTYPEKCKKIEK